MKRTSRSWLPLAVAVWLLWSGGAAAADTESMWLHVRVDEGGGGAKVRVNLPLSLMETALPMIPEVDRHGTWSPLDEADLEVEDLRRIWAEVRRSPDMTFVTVEEGEETVRVWKERGYLYVKVDDGRGEQVDVAMPESLVDAVLADQRPDIRALIEALAQHGGGDLVTVHDRRSGDRVRVWVDATPEAE